MISSLGFYGHSSGEIRIKHFKGYKILIFMHCFSEIYWMILNQNEFINQERKDTESGKQETQLESGEVNF